MKRCLQILFLLLLFLGSNGLWAQYSLQVSGFVRDAVGQPVINQEIDIFIWVFNPTTSVLDSVRTDSTGFYSYSNTFSNSSFGNLELRTTDCPTNNFAGLIDSADFSMGNDSFSIDFVYCENVCQANFSFNAFGLGVDFSDASNSPYGLASWFWEFGDGDTAFGPNPFHAYNQAGTYTTCLTISDSSGCSRRFCRPVQVAQCQADFQWVNPSPLEGVFNASATNTPSPTYLWDFGDGNNGTGISATHRYNSSGSYPVQLIVIDALYNCRDTALQLVNIQGDNECQALFNPIFLGRDSLFFENLSQTSNINSSFTSFQWTFGDGASSQDSTPTHVYQNPGDYLVCLLVEDGFGCRDSFCQIVSVLPGPVCDPSFLFSPISNLTVAFSALEITAENRYFWTLDDGNVYNSPSFFHTFSRPGTYEVCLFVSDTSGECRDSLCQTVLLSPNELCVSDFAWNQLDSNRIAFFQLAAVTDPLSSRFNWDFGDGTSSNQANPLHTYTGNGPWQVCLRIEDQLTDCVQETCYQVSKDSVAPSLFDLKGWIYENGIPSFDSRVLLYKNRPEQSLINRLGERDINFDIYEWNQLEPGSYLVYAEHKGDGNFIPTYLGGEIYWQDAISSVINNGHVVNPRLNMVEGLEVQGLGKIEGKIFEGLRLADGPALADEVVLLLADDPQRSPITYARTRTDGSYLLEGLPVGTYWVQPEIPGIYSAASRVVIANPGDHLSGISFGIGEQFGFPTSVEEKVSLEISPSPADHYINISTTFTHSKIQVFGVLGNLLFEGNLLAKSLRLTTSDWTDGVYVIKVEGGGQHFSKKVLIRHKN